MKNPKRLNIGVAHRYSPKQEKATAQRIGGHNPAGSGNQEEKGDARLTGVMRIENKATTKNSFSVTKEILDKIEDAALSGSELPFLQIDFIDKEQRVLRSCYSKN